MSTHSSVRYGRIHCTKVDAQPRAQPDAPVRGFLLGHIGGGAPVSLDPLGGLMERLALTVAVLLAGIAEAGLLWHIAFNPELTTRDPVNAFVHSMLIAAIPLGLCLGVAMTARNWRSSLAKPMKWILIVAFSGPAFFAVASVPSHGSAAFLLIGYIIQCLTALSAVISLWRARLTTR